MAKFKVGDRVRVRSWDDMEREFRLDMSGDIQITNRTPYFVKEMKPLCGQTATITDIHDDLIVLELDNKALSNNWNFAEEMLEPIKENETKEVERNMFYIKTKIAEGITVETELPREIFARCPKCGTEMKFDIFDIKELAGKTILCDTCGRKRGERNAEN